MPRRPRGVACWVAPRDVDTGTDYTEEIIEALRCARVLVLLAPTGACQSQHVKRDVRLAVEMALPTVPMQLDDAVLRPMFSYCLSGSQRLDTRGSVARKWAAEVLASIRRLDGDPAESPAPVDANAPAPPGKG